MMLDDIHEAFNKKISGRYVLVIKVYGRFIQKKIELNRPRNYIYREIKEMLKLNDDFKLISFIKSLKRMETKGYFNQKLEDTKFTRLSILDNYRLNSVIRKSKEDERIIISYRKRVKFLYEITPQFLRRYFF